MKKSRVSTKHTNGGGRYEVDAAIAVVVHRFGDDVAAVAGAVRQASVVTEEEPLAFEFDDGGVRGVRVAGYLADDTYGRVGTTDAIGYGACNLLGPLTGVGQVVLAVVLVHPRCLGEARHVNLVNLPVNLNHIVLQLGVVALLISPDDIRCALYTQYYQSV